MAKISLSQANVTPESTDKVTLQAQIDNQIAVLYDNAATVEAKEIAVYNYIELRGYFATLFHELPAAEIPVV